MLTKDIFTFDAWLDLPGHGVIALNTRSGCIVIVGMGTTATTFVPGEWWHFEYGFVEIRDVSLFDTLEEHEDCAAVGTLRDIGHGDL